MADSPYIFDVTGETFETYVLQNSHKVPVLVDFWAGWCQPCQMLMPVLARIVAEYDGKVLLAKVNSDEQQELSSMFGVRSLPTVKLFKDGKVVDEFMGVQPESAIRAILEKHVVRESDLVRQQALTHYRAGETDEAIRLLQNAMEMDPANDRPLVDLAGILAQQGKAEDAENLLRTLPLSRQQDDDIKALFSRLQMARMRAGAPDAATLKAKIEADPTDLEARQQLAAQYVADGELDAALEQFYEIMKHDRAFGDDAGRQGMLSVFEMLGGHGELVTSWRRKMAALMY